MLYQTTFVQTKSGFTGKIKALIHSSLAGGGDAVLMQISKSVLCSELLAVHTGSVSITHC
ncbi:MAG: hypothetical protein IPO48_03990 [Saprospiraceae bacterium]|nr:hypothetical protein [Saprospiraceae bacterium]